MLGWAMHKAYSLDLRERVVAAVEAGLRQAEVVRLFGASLATLAGCSSGEAV
jgi:transposase